MTWDCWSDYGTSLVINGGGETITPCDLTNLAPKQLLIFDCCRSYNDADFMAVEPSISLSRDPIRQAYEDKIRDSMPQEVMLFACDDGEFAWGTIVGSNFTHALFDATEMILDKSTSPFINISQVHRKAASLLRHGSYPGDTKQHPQIRQSRYATRPRLPWAVNPNFL